jgi:pyridoxine 5-phosphate synthase
MSVRLGVNIDHVATLRQARGEYYPSLVEAATVCLEAGADQITLHLREDRRHIQDTDLGAIKLVTERFDRLLNLEMGCTDEIAHIAETLAPEWICLVPEKREEKTTEGGLDLINTANYEKIARMVDRLKKRLNSTKISLFVESDLSTLELASKLPIDAVEIHTGEYARAFLNGEDTAHFIEQYFEARKFIQSKQIGYHAGHGLTFESTKLLVDQHLFEEYNIGHWIICQSVFDGLKNVVSSMVELIKAGSK